MAKNGKSGYDGLGFGKKGKQDVTTKGYDAMSDFKKTATPASVKGENYTGKGSKYKHDEN